MDEIMMVTPVSNPKLSTNTLEVNKKLALCLGLDNKDRISFFVGQCHHELDIKIKKSDKESVLWLNPVTIKKMYLRSGKKYGIKCEEDEIHIGPVVGIMADLYSETNKPFGGQSFFIRQLLESGNRWGELCFAFSPYSINWAKNTIHGYTYGKNGWVKGSFPIPNVIYPRERAYSREKLAIRKKLEKMGVVLVNPPLIGKWETYKILSNNPDLAPFLPDTKLIKNFSAQVDNMVKRYRAVYLKPVAGSQGKNIIRVVKKNNSSIYEYQYVVEKQQVKGRATSMAGLQRSLKRVMGNRSYIVQKQINLIKCDGNIIDVRVLVQKDQGGKWDTTGMACRMGKNGSITSNISSGGSGRKLNSVLSRNFADEAQREEILQDIKYVAIQAAKTLEASIGQSGEMGIDVGIDKDGKVWFIEANLRPARQVFTLIGEKETRLKSVEKPMLYARYLAGF